jgi:hypothetical protein
MNGLLALLLLCWLVHQQCPGLGVEISWPQHLTSHGGYREGAKRKILRCALLPRTIRARFACYDALPARISCVTLAQTHSRDICVRSAHLTRTYHAQIVREWCAHLARNIWCYVSPLCRQSPGNPRVILLVQQHRIPITRPIPLEQLTTPNYPQMEVTALSYDVKEHKVPYTPCLCCTSRDKPMWDIAHLVISSNLERNYKRWNWMELTYEHLSFPRRKKSAATFLSIS